MAEKSLHYVITDAELALYEVKKPDDVRLVITGDIEVNGTARKSKRVTFTLAATKREGFTLSGDNATRTVNVTLPSERTGRPRRSGTNLEIKL